jgi:hypothetical protein
MDTTQTAPETTVQIQAHYEATKRLGPWTTARDFEIRARRGSVVIDLRSAQIPEGDITIGLDLDHSMVKLLVPEDAVIDHWNLQWLGRGKVKQTFHAGTAQTGRRIVLTGQVRHGEVRVHSGGVAILSTMLSKECVEELRRAHRNGDTPTL